VLAGCENGNIIEVHRRSSQALRCFQCGMQLCAMSVQDADNRVLVVGAEKLQVWTLPFSSPSRHKGDTVPCGSATDDPVLLGSWSASGCNSGTLLHGGGMEDFIVAGTKGLKWGPPHLPRSATEERSELAKPVIAFALAPVENGNSAPSVAFVAFRCESVSSGAKGKATAELFELELPRLASSSESRRLSSPTDGTSSCEVPSHVESDAMLPLTSTVVDDVAGIPTADASCGAEHFTLQTEADADMQRLGMSAVNCRGADEDSKLDMSCDAGAKVALPRAAVNHESHYSDATVASRARYEAGLTSHDRSQHRPSVH